MLAALIRPIFNAESAEQARELVGDALERLRKPLPKIAALLEEAEEDLLAFCAFPVDHWTKLRSTDESVKGLGGGERAGFGGWAGRGGCSRGLRAAPVASFSGGRAVLGRFRAAEAARRPGSARRRPLWVVSAGVRLACGRG